MAATLIPPTRWGIRGRSAYRNVASGATLTCTTGLPSATSYTICGWGQRVASNATFEWLASITAGIPTSATDGMLIGWAASGTSIGVSSFTGGDNAFPTNYGTGERIFWSFSNSGTGATSLVGYTRRPQDPSLQIKTMTGSTFTVSVISLCNDTTAINEWLNGRVWNVRVFNHQLTAYEVMRESLSPIPIASGLLSWWPLEGNSTSMLKDCSGNGNHLTLTGTGRPDVFFLPASVLLPLPKISDVDDAAASGTTDAAFSLLSAASSTWVGAADASSAFNILDQQTQMQPTGAARADVPFSIAATAQLIGVGASLYAVPFTIQAQALLVAVGSTGTTVSAAFAIASVATFNPVGASQVAVPFSINAQGLFSPVGAAATAVPFVIGATALLVAEGSTGTLAQAAASIAATSSSTWITASNASGNASLLASSAGSFIGAGAVAVPFSINATAVLRLVGRNASAVTIDDDDETLDDIRKIWRDAAEIQRPVNYDEEELELFRLALKGAVENYMRAM